ncbi:hypothetical protein ACJEDT_19140 [Rhodococcoides fascians]
MMARAFTRSAVVAGSAVVPVVPDAASTTYLDAPANTERSAQP